MRRLDRFLLFYFRSFILRRSIPLIASMKLTYRCNLTCQACPFHRISSGPGTHMDWETACSSMDRLSDMGCPIMVFEGGEPLLWTDGTRTFSDLAIRARERFTCVGATTNGTLPLDVPTDILWVSLDGTRDTHDRLRSSSYERVMGNLKASRHAKLYVHVTLNALNYREFPLIAGACADIPSVKGITVQLFYPYGKGEEQLALSARERKEALSLVLAMKKEGFPIRNSVWGLKAMMDNSWSCREAMLVNVSPDGTISQGCYVRNRGEIDCSQCGFTPVAEASGAYALRPGPVLAGMRIFLAP
jgi:MoaA/NifB/PqqE/SkfB family radical SAM enzyme